MTSDEQIFKKYPGFRFLATQKRPIYLYFILYYVFFAVFALVFPHIHIFILFFISWVGIMWFHFFTRFHKGLAKYLNKHDENLRLYIFDDKIYNENAIPLFSVISMIKLFRLKNKDLDQNLKNLRDNELASVICTITVFFAFFIFIIIHTKNGGI